MSASLAPADILVRLKCETDAAHRALETRLIREARFSSREAYAGLLVRLYGYFAEAEPRIGAALADPGFFEPRRKIPLLEQDLRDLGFADREIEQSPRCPETPLLATPEDALGALYVSEGATLGGKQIVQMVSDHLGLSDAGGCRYFGSYGARRGAMWRAFQDRLLAAAPAAETAIILNARRTFEIFGRWL